MLSKAEPESIQPNSDRENLLHLVNRICPRDVTESADAYNTFCELALTGNKSIREFATEQGIDLEILKTWGEDFHWAERLKAWRPIREAFRRKQWQAREQAILERWNDRRARFLEAADQLLAKADLMLKHPHVQKVIHEEVIAEYKGQIVPTQVVISPVKWQSGDVATLQKTAMALLKEVIGDRQIMIDRLTSDGYIITDPNSDDTDIEEYLEAIERLEELESGL